MREEACEIFDGPKSVLEKARSFGKGFSCMSYHGEIRGYHVFSYHNDGQIFTGYPIVFCINNRGCTLEPSGSDVFKWLPSVDDYEGPVPIPEDWEIIPSEG